LGNFGEEITYLVDINCGGLEMNLNLFSVFGTMLNIVGCVLYAIIRIWIGKNYRFITNSPDKEILLRSVDGIQIYLLLSLAFWAVFAMLLNKGKPQPSMKMVAAVNILAFLFVLLVNF
jgi:uncharacterized membrane protein YwaF